MDVEFRETVVSFITFMVIISQNGAIKSQQLQATACQKKPLASAVCFPNESVVLETIQLIKTGPSCSATGCCKFDKDTDVLIETHPWPTSNQTLVNWRGAPIQQCPFLRNNCILPTINGFPPPWIQVVNTINYNYRCIPHKDSMTICGQGIMTAKLLLLYHDRHASGNTHGICKCVAYSDNCGEHAVVSVADVTQFQCSLKVQDDDEIPPLRFTCGDSEMLSGAPLMSSRRNYLKLSYSSTGGTDTDRIALTVYGNSGSNITVICGNSDHHDICNTTPSATGPFTTTSLLMTAQINSTTDTYRTSKSIKSTDIPTSTSATYSSASPVDINATSAKSSTIESTNNPTRKNSVVTIFSKTHSSTIATADNVYSPTKATLTSHSSPISSRSSVALTEGTTNSPVLPSAESSSDNSQIIFIAIGVISAAVVVIGVTALALRLISKSIMKISPWDYPLVDIGEENTRTRYIHHGKSARVQTNK